MDIEEISNYFKAYICNQEQSYILRTKAIELRRDARYGRMLVAKENLKPGDVIAVEEPFFMSLDKSDEQNTCASCLKEILIPFICDICKEMKFCSRKCQDNCWNLYHKYECENFHEIDCDDSFLLMMNRMLFKSIKICGSLEKLNDLIESIDDSLTIFDADDLNDDEKILKCCYNLECGNIDEDFIFIDSYIGSPFFRQFCCSKEKHEILKGVILKILGILNRNSFSISLKSNKAGAVYPLGSLINHSCSPNLEKINVGSKAIFICNRPVAKSEQLFLCYRRPFYHDHDHEMRRMSLYRQFNFLCECEACTDEKFLHYSGTLKMFNTKIITFAMYKENCTLIYDNKGKYPCSEIIKAIYENKKFLQEFLNEY